MTKQEKDKMKNRISNMETEKIESAIFTQEKRLEREKFLFDALVAELQGRKSKKGGNVNGFRKG